MLSNKGSLLRAVGVTFAVAATAGGSGPASAMTAVGPRATGSTAPSVPAAVCDGDSFRLSVSAGGSSVTYPAYVAAGGGFFEAEGLDVEFVDLGGSGIITSAVVSGDVDGGVATLPGIAEAIAAGAPVRAIASLQEGQTFGIALSPGYMEALGLEPGELLTLDQYDRLVGLRGGVSQVGGGGDAFMNMLLEAGGLERDRDFEIVSMGETPIVVASLREGTIDAGIVSPSVYSTLAEFGAGFLFDPVAHDLADISPELAPFDNQQGSVITVNVDRLDDADSVRVFECALRAIARAQEAIHADPEAAGQLAIESFTGIEGDAYAEFAAGMAAMTPETPVLDRDVVEGTFLYIHQTTGVPVELTYEDVADNAIAERAVSAG